MLLIRSSCAGRIEDCKAKVLLTCSGVMRGTKKIDLKKIADKAVDMCTAQNHKVRPCVHEPA